MTDAEATAARPPWAVDRSEPEFAAHAAQSLIVNGFVALRGPIVPEANVTMCAEAIYDRLDALLSSACQRGMDIDAGLLRFNEVCKRHTSARYDLRLPLGRPTDLVPTDAADVPGSETWCQVHQLVDRVVRPILQEAFSYDRAPYEDWAFDAWASEVAGCVLSMPGCGAQASHADGTSPALVNAFVPLVAVDARNGTELMPSSHLDTLAMPSDALAALPGSVVPTLKPGELLLFCYRTVHRGLPNKAGAPRPVLYFTYGADGAVDNHNFPSDAPLLAGCADGS